MSIRDLLWRTPLGDKPRLVRFGITVGRYVFAIVRDLIGGQLTLRVMGLVYTTLLSIVPLLAFSFALLKGLDVHVQIEEYLSQYTSIVGKGGEKLLDDVFNAVENVKGSLLGPLALAFFIYTAIAMVQKVESSFNYVWHVSEPRSLARRITEYVSVLLIGPIVMVFALGLIATIESQSLVQKLAGIKPFGWMLLTFGKILPTLLIIAVFTFLYQFLPNARVQFRASLVGALVAGTSWAITGSLFAEFVAQSTARLTVYGAFATPLVALLWLYFSWLILLVGGQIAFYYQNPIFLRIGRREPRLSNDLRERIALNTMYIVGREFRAGDERATTESVSVALNVPELTIGPVLGALERAGLICINETGELVPGREMSRIQLDDILNVVRSGGETGSLMPPHWSAPVDEIAESLQDALGAITRDLTLADLLDRAEEPKDTDASVAGDRH